jgi:hypothetical protein
MFYYFMRIAFCGQLVSPGSIEIGLILNALFEDRGFREKGEPLILIPETGERGDILSETTPCSVLRFGLRAFLAFAC